MERLERKGVLYLMCLLFPCFSYAAKISLCISEKADNKPAMLYFPNGDKLPIDIDANGNGTLTVDIERPTYASLSYYYASRTLYLTPDTDLKVTFEGKKFGQQVTLDGQGAPVNIYLNSGRLQATGINDTELGETAFIQKTDSLLQANLTVLKNSRLPESFNQAEAKRLRYFSYATLPSYPYFHARIARDSTYQASPAYWEKMHELMSMDASLLDFEEYRTFMAEAVSKVAKQRYPEQKRLDALIAYTEKEVTEPAIAEFLIAKNVFAYIEKNGLDGADAYCQAFERRVKSPTMVETYQALRHRWLKLAVGAPSPRFNATDLAGKPVTLDDFKGKYVYIDIWATWCGPCKREIPHLQKLEEKYHGKDIYFVSISCDTNRKAWEKRVNAGLKGIQLHFTPGDTFMDEYMISGIPRFILLDREGKIISADMTRPSDAATVTTLDKLLN